MKQPYVDLRSQHLDFEIDSYAGQLLGWGYFEAKPWRNFLHIHSYYEVCFVFSGYGSFRINHQKRSPKKGDLFLARPNDLHEIISSEDDPLGIFFYGFTLQPISTELQDKPITKLIDEFIGGSRVLHQVPEIEPLLAAFTEEVDRFDIGSQYALQGLAVKIVLDTIRALSDFQSEVISIGSRVEGGLANEVGQFLKDNLSRPLQVRDVATQFHLSERHINRVFKSETGRPIMRFLQELRIKRAKELLLLSDRPIGEIAEAVGFKDSRYFATHFRQRTGVTPTAFRQKNGTIFTVSS